MARRESLLSTTIAIGDAMSAALRPKIEAAGLRPAAFDLLSAIHAADGRETQSSIGERLGLSRATITEASQSLISAGWVMQVPSPSDKRARLLQLTPEGHRKMAEAINAIQALEKHVSESLTASEREQAAKLLQKMLVALQNSAN